jgi:thioester reductase-like protein
MHSPRKLDAQEVRKKIFLTGATGFVGGHLLLFLLRQTNAEIYCLVRPKKNIGAEERLRARLSTIMRESVTGDRRFLVDLDREWSRITVLEGDLRTDRFGISDSRYRELSASEIWHVGANIDFADHRKERVFETNVQGVRRILEFAHSCEHACLNYVSTAYVCGQRDGIIPEDRWDEQYPSNNVYEESKRIAEREVFAAHDRFNLRFRIFRPSVVVGHSRTLAVDMSSGLHTYLLAMFKMKESVESRMPDYFSGNPLRLLMEDDATLNLICVDHVVDLMYRFSSREDTIGNIIHLANPYSTNVPELTRMLPAILGIPVETQADPQQLNTIDSMLNAQMAMFRAYLLKDKQFDFTKLSLTGLSPESFRLSEHSKQELLRRSYEYHLKLRTHSKRASKDS